MTVNSVQLMPPSQYAELTDQMPSRFDRQMRGQLSWLNELHTVTKQVAVVKVAQRTLDYQQRQTNNYHGITARGEMYQIGVSFALENEGVYSEPLPSVEGNRLYQIRVALAQYQAVPLTMGWALQWALPVGWTFFDGLPAVTYEEFVSNPTIVTRMLLSPVAPVPAGFQITVVGKYP